MSLEIGFHTNMCRACMKEGGKMLPMYDEANNKINLPHKLAELTSVQVDKCDGLPNMLCSKCAYRTNIFYDFKLKVQETDKILRMILKNQMDVKSEELNEHNKEDRIMQIDESFELNTLNDKISVHSDCLKDPEIISETIKDEQRAQSVENDNDCKESNLQLEDIVCNLIQEANGDETNVQLVKTEIPEEISKMLDSPDITIMYIPKSVIESITEPNAENTLDVPNGEEESLGDGDEMFLSEVEALTKQESEDILSGMSISSLVESNVAGKIKRVCQNDNATRNENKKVTLNENDSNVEQSTRGEDSDGSDYFIDAQDNILGSLNDAITRIKEVKQENGIEYQCTLCLQNYDQVVGVLLHTIDNHIPSSGPFFCIVCEKDCESHRELRTHAKTHTGQFPYTCFICKKAYTMKRYLKRHMVCHPDFQRHRCPKCGRRFKVKSELESHMVTHLHGAPYACSQCPRRFNHKGNYKRHLISHLDPQGLHLPKYPCRYCGKRFSNNRTLETHMRVHTGEKPFKCEVCNKLFSQQGNLLNHAKIHWNPRSYTCEVCGKSFNQRATLRDHGLLHTGEKPYVCNVCGKAFTFSAALRRHMFSHKPDGKPFRCEICGTGFVGKYDLRRHMRVHTDRPKEKRRRNATSKSNNRLQEEAKVECFTVVEQPEM
ncbi:zinc finger protein 436 isoform X2 [Ooceraea biroi]|uniref:zinc finger protein 436 isoform X2 n=1 Tax=Ooceraea biroi TaxID=2015173 RepID=UPI000F098F50|nr:zinc finger protein 436 isoform X2 [Ooceraea biroi]